MRILHITDSHGTMKSPAARQDVYFISFLEKMMEVAYRIREFNVDMVIHTGDLFHTSRVSDKFTGMLAEIIRRFGVPMYVVPGNHDIDGYNLNTIDQTKLGLLYKTGVVKELDRDNPIEVTTQDGARICIAGQEYYAGIDEGNTNDFSMQTKNYGDLNILCIHGYIVNEQQPAEVKCTQASSIVTDADVILSGHFHRAVCYEADDFSVYNPGSMMRVEQTEYNKTHMPQFGILDITGNANTGLQYEYTYHTFKCAKQVAAVFNYNAKYIAKGNSITLEGFKNSIANTMSSVRQSGFSTISIIDQVCKQTSDISQQEEQEIKQFYNDTFLQMPEEYVTRKGYIEDQSFNTISRVEINNFQSHTNTVINFDDGMNIIEGESNEGKTAIFRAILWVIDNRPLGTDFITQGANTCSVKITFSNGNTIERSRSRKDTGYYRIGDNSSGKLIETDYKGFTNNVPVEVDNIHQMPMVQISKDIVTHLNVASQFDPPFMVTDSPQNRAQAIGRITGVHIIDAVIKRANSKVLADNKQIKAVKKSLEAHQKDLAGRPDLNIVMNAIQAMNRILYHVKGEEGNISLVRNKINEINNILTQVSFEKTNVEKYSKIVEFGKHVLTDTTIKAKEYSSIKTLYDKYNETLSKMNEMSASISKYEYVANILPLINNVSSKLSFVRYMGKLYGELNTNNGTIQALNASIGIKERCNKAYEMIFTHSTILYNDINHLHKLNESFKSLTNDISNETNREMSIHKAYTDANDGIHGMIISHGVCPCCGKPIELGVGMEDEIFKFMTGGK